MAFRPHAYPLRPLWQFPPVIAHRGAPLVAPENTLSGLRCAHTLGARWVEFDVMLTQDNVCIVFHDDTLERTSNGQGLVADTPYSTIQTLDAGSWFGTAFSDQTIPTFAQYLLTAMELGLGINIELKPVPGKEAALAEELCKVLVKHVHPKSPTPILISSFSAPILAQLNKYLQEYARYDPLALNLRTWDLSCIQQATDLGCYSIHVPHQQVHQEMIHAHEQAHLLTLAYTVNDRVEAQRLLDMGVSAVFSDNPSLLMS